MKTLKRNCIKNCYGYFEFTSSNKFQKVYQYIFERNKMRKVELRTCTATMEYNRRVIKTSFESI